MARWLVSMGYVVYRNGTQAWAKIAGALEPITARAACEDVAKMLIIKRLAEEGIAPLDNWLRFVKSDQDMGSL